RRVTNCNPAGVIAEQAYKHRARDAGPPADLRLFRTSACLDAARRRGPWVRQLKSCAGPGVPRALVYSRGEGMTSVRPRASGNPAWIPACAGMSGNIDVTAPPRRSKNRGDDACPHGEENREAMRLEPLWPHPSRHPLRGLLRMRRREV